MRPSQSEPPFVESYLLFLALQVPLWLLGGLVWAGFMIAMEDLPPINGFLGGFGWGLLMLLTVGNLLSIAGSWRRSMTFLVTDRKAFRSALDWACDKAKLIVLRELPDEVVLGPKRVPVRFRAQEVRVTFGERETILTAPAASFGVVVKAVKRALEQRAGG